MSKVLWKIGQQNETTPYILASPVLRGRQWPQRNTLSTLKKYPFKEITEKIVFYSLEIHIAQLLTYLRAKNIVINFNVDRLENGIERVI